MIFWEDLVKAAAAADKTVLELAEALRRRQLEVEVSVESELTGTETQNRARVTRAVLADAALAELVHQHRVAENERIDAQAELTIASNRLNERLVEAHETNMKIAEQIHRG